MTLPEKIDPVKFARTQTVLSGELKLSTCPRLQAACDQGDALARVNLAFQNVDRRYLIIGALDAPVQSICQRCGDPVSLRLQVDVSLCAIVSESQAKSLPAEYDPLVTGGEPVLLTTLVEDELLLSLPMVTMHEAGGCQVDFPEYFNA